MIVEITYRTFIALYIANKMQIRRVKNLFAALFG